MTTIPEPRFATRHFSHCVLAGLLATAGSIALAQLPAGSPPDAAAGQSASGAMRHHDPAKMQAMMAKHHAAVKAKLQLTAEQEPAWAAYTAAMQPPVRGENRPAAAPGQGAELDQLTTPERIDKLRALRTQRMADMAAAMDRRGEATKTFYATLSPAQKAVFDAEHQRRAGHYGVHHGGGKG